MFRCGRGTGYSFDVAQCAWRRRPRSASALCPSGARIRVRRSFKSGARRTSAFLLPGDPPRRSKSHLSAQPWLRWCLPAAAPYGSRFRDRKSEKHRPVPAMLLHRVPLERLVGLHQDQPQVDAGLVVIVYPRRLAVVLSCGEPDPFRLTQRLRAGQLPFVTLLLRYRHLQVPHLSRLVIRHRLQDFLASIHHERTVAHYRLVDRLTAQHQQNCVLFNVERDSIPLRAEERDLRFALQFVEPSSRHIALEEDDSSVVPRRKRELRLRTSLQSTSKTLTGLSSLPGQRFRSTPPRSLVRTPPRPDRREECFRSSNPDNAASTSCAPWASSPTAAPFQMSRPCSRNSRSCISS